MIQGLFDNGSMPVVERMVQFTEARHRLLTHNVANLSTPYFKPADVSPREFQATLREAVERRRERDQPVPGPLRMRPTRRIEPTADGLKLNPEPANDNVLFHDQNNRDVNRLMAQLAENAMTHNASVELLRNQFAILETAIRERV